MGQYFRCQKEFGGLSINWSAIRLGQLNIIPPEGMNADDQVCGKCKDELAKERKSQNKEAKEAMKEEFNELVMRSGEYKQNWNKTG